VGRQAVRIGRIQIDDVIEVVIRGRRLLGRVTDVKDGVVHFNLICPGAGWRHAKAREIVTHWRKSGRRATHQTPPFTENQ
jgi:hypothetical protein